MLRRFTHRSVFVEGRLLSSGVLRHSSSSSSSSTGTQPQPTTSPRQQQRLMRQWFDTVISLGANPLEPLSSTAGSLAVDSNSSSGGDGIARPLSPLHPSSSIDEAWLQTIISPIAKEARAILKALQNADALGVDLPESLISALWSVFDRLYLVRYRDLTVADKLALEARQYEYFLLMSQAGLDAGKVDELATRIKVEADALAQQKLSTTLGRIGGGGSGGASSSSSPSSFTTTTLVRLVEDLRSASMPLFHRWLKQSATMGHIVSDAATVSPMRHSSASPSSSSSSSSSSVVEYDLHERFGGRVRVGGALNLPGAHGVQKIIMLRAALLKAITRIEKRKRNGTLAEVAAAAGATSSSSSSSPSPPPLTAEALDEWYEERRTALQVLNTHCFALLKQWMRHGEGIVMREVRWDQTAPSILEKVIAAENVHPFEFPALSSLRHRLQPTARKRHLFCFFHEGIGYDEPLIAVQVALTKGISNSVDDILGRKKVVALPTDTAEGISNDASGSTSASADEPFDTAIFYSINSAQVGLKGVDLGNSLIKAVVKHLKSKYPHQLRHFSTLSPIPTYVPWLKGEVKKISKALADSPEAPSLGLHASSSSTAAAAAPTIRIDAGADIHDDAHIAALAEAIVTSGSTIFGPRVRTASSSASASAVATAAGSGGDDLMTFSLNPEPPHGPVSKAVIKQWLQQISSAIKAIVTEQQHQQYANVLEALVDILSPPPPKKALTAAAAATTTKPKKKDPIAAMHTIPERLLHPQSSSTSTSTANATAAAIKPNWWAVPTVPQLLETPLSHSISCFLACEKKRGRIADPVGNFHVGNGAVLWRVNWMGNQTMKGSVESACCMVNYWYNLEANAANARGYELARAVPVGAPLKGLWGSSSPSPSTTSSSLPEKQPSSKL